jgi:hypothetical protein
LDVLVLLFFSFVYLITATLQHCNGLLLFTFLFVHIQRGAMGECYAIGCVEGTKVNLFVADARLVGYDSAQ